MKRREVEMLWKPGKIELLAPARDLRSARAAIDCGADAVYMGGPRFGARQAAGNSVADIAAVAEYARRFGVRVYVTLNTLLFDDELADAERIARQVVEAGADALIVQDMAYLEMELEGVELHASTQTFNASPERRLTWPTAVFRALFSNVTFPWRKSGGYGLPRMWSWSVSCTGRYACVTAGGVT